MKYPISNLWNFLNFKKNPNSFSKGLRIIFYHIFLKYLWMCNQITCVFWKGSVLHSYKFVLFHLCRHISLSKILELIHYLIDTVSHFMIYYNIIIISAFLVVVLYQFYNHFLALHVENKISQVVTLPVVPLWKAYFFYYHINQI
jgi:hypothetical protein